MTFRTGETITIDGAFVVNPDPREDLPRPGDVFTFEGNPKPYRVMDVQPTATGCTFSFEPVDGQWPGWDQPDKDEE